MNGNFSQPYSVLGSFLTKTNGFFNRWKMRSHLPSLVVEDTGLCLVNIAVKLASLATERGTEAAVGNTPGSL